MKITICDRCKAVIPEPATTSTPSTRSIIAIFSDDAIRGSVEYGDIHIEGMPCSSLSELCSSCRAKLADWLKSEEKA